TFLNRTSLGRRYVCLILPRSRTEFVAPLANARSSSVAFRKGRSGGIRGDASHGDGRPASRSRLHWPTMPPTIAWQPVEGPSVPAEKAGSTAQAPLRHEG